MLAISLQSLQQLISQAVDAGIQSYQKELSPAADRIKKSDAKKLIARYGYKPVMIDRWTDAGLLRPEKGGEAQNAACWYSVAAIKELFASISLKRACNDSLLYTIKRQ